MTHKLVLSLKEAVAVTTHYFSYRNLKDASRKLIKTRCYHLKIDQFVFVLFLGGGVVKFSYCCS